MEIEKRADINLGDFNNNTPLIHAAMVNSPDAVLMLIEAGADIYARNRSGKTAMDIAREKNHNEIIEIFENRSAYEH